MARMLDDLTEFNSSEWISLETMNARLIRSGVPSRILHSQRSNRERFNARYRVRVNGLCSAIVSPSMRGSNSGGLGIGRVLSSGLEDGLCKRMEKAAIRALYTLGTDVGEVEIIALPGRRYAVNEIIPSKMNPPSQNSKLVVSKGQDAETRILMGMDPEFILVNKEGYVVPASLYLDRFGTAGSDAVRVGDEVTYPLAELRPAPHADPDRLLKAMRQAMFTAQQCITDTSLQWRAGGLPAPGLPLGGHIHFSGVPLTMSVLQCLDNYLALPLAIVEDPAGRGRRPRYGFLGDFRIQPYGGFEYRTLPSFMVSPLISKASLYIAYLIVLHHDRLRARPLNRERYHKAYYGGQKEVLREVAEKLHQDLARLPEYLTYNKVIDRLFEHIEEGKNWDESRDIRPLWNIPAVP